jgi:hypothetical protein
MPSASKGIFTAAATIYYCGKDASLALGMTVLAFRLTK